MRVISKKEMLQYFAKPSYYYGEPEFYSDLMDFYNRNQKRVKRSLSIKHDDFEIRDFCTNYHGNLDYENLCSFALILSKIIGVELPSNIHYRMVFGPSNKFVKEYVEHVSNLKPLLFGFVNLNRKKISNIYLSSNGHFKQKTYK